MAFGELPSRVVAEISFVGRGGGAVKSLSGFRKGQHTVPDAANSMTNAFLAKICQTELAEEAEGLFQSARATFGYKRKEIALTLASPHAELAARDFTVEVVYALEEREPSRYVTTTTLRGLRDAECARGEPMSRLFAAKFSEISFALKKGARVEAVIDAIESLAGEGGLAVDFPSDCRDCVIRVEGVDAKVRCTGGTLEMVFPSTGSPRELIEAFAAVRDAFQINKALAGLIQ